jgi:CubicO group peptidase (beta-lactamase class C family)
VLEDVTGTPFADLMAELVFEPLGMTGSGFGPDFPATSGRPVALGHDDAGATVPGGWERRTDLAAAGLWSTATDLGRIVREIRVAALGGAAALLDEGLAGQMLTAGVGGIWGLGCTVDRVDESEVEYAHRGRMDGYRAVTAGRVRAGTGVVLLTNGDGGGEILALLAGADEGSETA